MKRLDLGFLIATMLLLSWEIVLLNTTHQDRGLVIAFGVAFVLVWIVTMYELTRRSK